MEQHGAKFNSRCRISEVRFGQIRRTVYPNLRNFGVPVVYERAMNLKLAPSRLICPAL